jgi:hypothetical protein
LNIPLRLDEDKDKRNPFDQLKINEMTLRKGWKSHVTIKILLNAYGSCNDFDDIS